MKYFFLLFFPFLVQAQDFTTDEINRYRETAKRVEIILDNYGIPHIYGQTDADAVFGLLYVQSSQNFERVERNYLEVMGRLSEVDGESSLFTDLQMQMIYDTAEAKKDYQKSPQWLKKLLHAFASRNSHYLKMAGQ